MSKGDTKLANERVHWIDTKFYSIPKSTNWLPPIAMNLSQDYDVKSKCHHYISPLLSVRHLPS